MKALTGSRFMSTLSLSSALGGGGWSASRPGRFTRGQTPGTQCTRGWMGRRVGMDGWWKSCPTGLRSSDRPARSESLYRLSYPGSHPLDVAHKRIMKRSGLSVWAPNNRGLWRCWPKSDIHTTYVAEAVCSTTLRLHCPRRKNASYPDFFVLGKLRNPFTRGGLEVTSAGNLTPSVP